VVFTTREKMMFCGRDHGDGDGSKSMIRIYERGFSKNE
jgi:hypothetical protein